MVWLVVAVLLYFFFAVIFVLYHGLLIFSRVPQIVEKLPGKYKESISSKRIIYLIRSELMEEAPDDLTPDESNVLVWIHIHEADKVAVLKKKFREIKLIAYSSFGLLAALLALAAVSSFV